MMTTQKRPQEMDRFGWITPPRYQGQAVEVSYGQDVDGDCWERTVDRSVWTTEFRYLGHASDAANTSWEPWNDVPAMALG